MSVGDKEFYPAEYDDVGRRGVTYREWLIGMALAALGRASPQSCRAAEAIRLADLVLNLLDGEAEK